MRNQRTFFFYHKQYLIYRYLIILKRLINGNLLFLYYFYINYVERFKHQKLIA